MTSKRRVRSEDDKKKTIEDEEETKCDASTSSVPSATHIQDSVKKNEVLPQEDNITHAKLLSQTEEGKSIVLNDMLTATHILERQVEETDRLKHTNRQAVIDTMAWP